MSNGNSENRNLWRAVLVKHHRQNRIAVYFEGTPELVDRIKKLNGVRWSNTLKEIFASYNLTAGQSSLIDELEIFLGDNSNCFLLKGYAGKGKTFMMKGVTEGLKYFDDF